MTFLCTTFGSELRDLPGFFHLMVFCHAPPPFLKRGWVTTRTCNKCLETINAKTVFAEKYFDYMPVPDSIFNVVAHVTSKSAIIEELLNFMH